MSNPYAVMKTSRRVHRDLKGKEVYEDDHGRFYDVQRTDDGTRVYYDGNNWIDVRTLQPIGRANQTHTQHQGHTRQQQHTSHPASQQHSAQNQQINQNQQQLAVLQQHHNNLVQSVNQLKQHVHDTDTLTNQNNQALLQQIAEIQKHLNSLDQHVTKQILAANEELRKLTAHR